MRALTTALLVVVLATSCSNTESDQVAELQLEMNAEEPTATPTTEPTPTTALGLERPDGPTEAKKAQCEDLSLIHI